MEEILSKFATEKFPRALDTFFEHLGIPTRAGLESPGALQDFLNPEKVTLRDELRDKVGEVYLYGLVDENAFTDEETDITAQDLRKEKHADYDGILLFGIELTDHTPSRTTLATLTRLLNRSYNYTPVVVVFRYGDFIAFANCERIQYKQRWREGEKAGKVSLLKDIRLTNTHTGHLKILKKLQIPTSGRNAVRSYQDLYYYWQHVLSISVLNKEFYKEIISWFNYAIERIKLPSIQSGSEKQKDFTIRLISRMIFLWFLKELGVVKNELLEIEFANGTVNSLIHPETDGSSYYKFILQNLFFNTLNKEKQDRDDSLFDIYGSNFNDPQKIKELIDFSPFLNGGLFDVHKNDHYVEGEVNNALKVPDEIFLDPQSGLNSLLARYKFTIAENTPYEEEVAVDPEMLGRIFENLLAEQTEDTQKAARKNAGAFYTPRPVVSYMCRNVLKKHIGTEIREENGKEIIQKLLDTKILDPACGSGAFLIGMLEEMMNVLDVVDKDGTLWFGEMLDDPDEDFRKHIKPFILDKQVRYVKKLGLLRNCLFGIDILEYAVEITKLRCWLSLIIEQRVNFDQPNFNLKPLPNLEFKFYQRDSLQRTFWGFNINDLVLSLDNKNLLSELIELEDNYFISRAEKQETRKEIEDRIYGLLEKVVDRKITEFEILQKESFRRLNKLRDQQASNKEIKKEKRKQNQHAKKIAELQDIKEKIKSYLIETVIFPQVFHKKQSNPGFDIVISNPPYVNTKQISSMGMTQILENEYGYCDDLYNHFTVRGLELIKDGGYLSYITSDTFLTLQTKTNMRKIFLGIEGLPEPEDSKQTTIAFSRQGKFKLHEIINTPKAFAALIDTAIFTVEKMPANQNGNISYTDLRFPDETTFDISKEEWERLQRSNENIAGWEKVLDKAFNTMGDMTQGQWEKSHTCLDSDVFEDQTSKIERYRVEEKVYHDAINNAIFVPNKRNCQVLEQLIQPAKATFRSWWGSIRTSRLINSNREEIKKYRSTLEPGDISLIGLLTDGGQGLATGNNGGFVGYREGTNQAKKLPGKRAEKLYRVVNKYPDIKKEYPILSDCNLKSDFVEVLEDMAEKEIWELFDSIKDDYGLRVFGTGFIYRRVPNSLMFDTEQISEVEKQNGIKSEAYYVPYDKGDKEGNRWYLETPFAIDWSCNSVKKLQNSTRARWQGYNFFFRNGFCWSDVLNPNSEYIKCRLKGKTVNDVKSMSLYDENDFGDEYYVVLINSYLYFKMLREFFNNTVSIQINDIRKLPIKIPNSEELERFKHLFNQCLAIKKQYFNNELTEDEMEQALEPIEKTIDSEAEAFYGISIDA